MKLIKKIIKKTDLNQPELIHQILESWEEDNIIKNKPKQITKPNFQSTQCFYYKIEEKNINSKRKRNNLAIKSRLK
jgi:chromosomal replication initiation ATPase DnaA